MEVSYPGSVSVPGGLYLAVHTEMQDPVAAAPEPWAQASGACSLSSPREGPLTSQTEVLSANASCGWQGRRVGPAQSKVKSVPVPYPMSSIVVCCECVVEIACLTSGWVSGEPCSGAPQSQLVGIGSFCSCA